MKCIFCDGEDVHECPGGTCDVHDDNAFSRGAYSMDVYPGKVDARSMQPPKYETRLSIDRLLAEARPVGSGDLCGKHCVDPAWCGCERIEAKSRELTPDGKWKYGSPENCGDPSCEECEHKPRGGFEFL